MLRLCLSIGLNKAIYARPADLVRKYHIYHYRHIFVYLLDNIEKREENTLQS
jgi:hypothetical protein